LSGRQWHRLPACDGVAQFRVSRKNRLGPGTELIFLEAAIFFYFNLFPGKDELLPLISLANLKLETQNSKLINGSMKGVPALSPLPRWGTTPGEGEFNLFSAPINNSDKTVFPGQQRPLHPAV
jgi:hypothetical protein